MKKYLYCLVLLLLLIPIYIKAGTYSEETTKTNAYMDRSNYVNTYKRYLINGGSIPFAYSSGGLNVDPSFVKGGFISKDEFDITKVNGLSYLFDGTEYWTLTKNGSNVYAVTYDNMETAKPQSSNYRSRPNEYVKHTTKVTGSGTFEDPWIFEPVYMVTITADSRYATINTSENNAYVRGNCNDSDCKAEIGVSAKSGYRYITNGCNGYYNNSTKKFELINVKKDTICNVVFGIGIFEIKLNGGAVPNKVYLKFEENYYTQSDVQTVITQLTTKPTKTGAEFKGYKTPEGVVVVNEDGTFNINSIDKIYSDLELNPRFDTTVFDLTVEPNGGTWNGSTANKVYTEDYGTTMTIPNPTATPKYTITYNANSQGATYTASPTSVSRPFTNWTKTGSGTLSGTTFTFGNGNTVLTANYNTTSNSFTLPTITKAGYACSWAEGSTSGTKYAGGTSREISANTTYYAVCTVESYKLTVNPNGGTWNSSTATQEFTQNYGTTKSIPNPTVVPKYTISYNMGNTGVTAPTSPTTVNRAFTSWTNAGNGTLSGTTYTFGIGNGSLTANYNTTSNSFTLPSLTKTGYTCKWAEGTSSGTQYAGGTSRTITANKTYYAKCTINSYKLTVNPNGGTWNSKTTNSEFTQNYGTTLTIGDPTVNAKYTITYEANSQGASFSGTPNNVTRSFTGWSKSGSGSFSNKVFTFGAGAGTLTATYNETSDSFTLPTITKVGYNCKWAEGSASGTQSAGGSSKTITKNTTYYAVCTPKVFTVTLNNQSATSAGSTAIYEKYNTGYYKESGCTNKMTTSANGITVPTKTNNTFGGYYTAANGGGTQYINASGKLTSNASTTYFNANGTLYAKWILDSYTNSNLTTFTYYAKNQACSNCGKLLGLAAAGQISGCGSDACPLGATYAFTVPATGNFTKADITVKYGTQNKNGKYIAYTIKNDSTFARANADSLSTKFQAADSTKCTADGTKYKNCTVTVTMTGLTLTEGKTYYVHLMNKSYKGSGDTYANNVNVLENITVGVKLYK